MSAAAIMDPTWREFLDGPSPPAPERRPDIVRHELRAPVRCRRCERPTLVVEQHLEPLRISLPVCCPACLETESAREGRRRNG